MRRRSRAYRKLAQKDSETYLPYVAMMLNRLGILDSAQNRFNAARKEHQEALETYRKLAQDDPQTFRPYVAAADGAKLVRPFRGLRSTTCDVCEN